MNEIVGATLEFDYLDSTGSITHWTVTCEAIWQKDGRTYLRGQDSLSHERRTFRVSRISGVSCPPGTSPHLNAQAFFARFLPKTPFETLQQVALNVATVLNYVADNHVANARQQSLSREGVRAVLDNFNASSCAKVIEKYVFENVPYRELDKAILATRRLANDLHVFAIVASYVTNVIKASDPADVNYAIKAWDQLADSIKGAIT